MALYASMVVGTAVLFLSALLVNEWLFSQSEFVRGINWVYLPAGIRLLCTLLFGSAGALGLLIASWMACFFHFFPDDFIRSFVGGILSAAAPYLVYRIVQQRWGLQRSLANLTPSRLVICAVAYAATNAALHHAWFLLNGNVSDLASSFVLMFAGDLNGALLMMYAIKAWLYVAGRRRA